jgi:ferredoxin
MPKIPRKPQRSMTFLEYLIERHIGPPSYHGANYAKWVCPFHNDHDPSFCTRPHDPRYKDRWTCFGCGNCGDEFDFLRLFHPDENYGDQLERLRQLRAEYEASGLADGDAIPLRGSGSTAGETILRALLRAGQIDHGDLLEVVAELNVRRELAMEWKRLGRKGEAA